MNKGKYILLIMNFKIFLIGFLLTGFGMLIAGCVTNQPAVGPDGTIAVFLNDEGKIELFPKKGTLTLFKEGKKIPLENANVQLSGGSLDWSSDGSELIYVEGAEPNEWGIPEGWSLQLIKTQTKSEEITLFSSSQPIINPSFTPENNIAYLGIREKEADGENNINSGNTSLYIYNRKEDVHHQMLKDIVSYKLMKSSPTIAVISITGEKNLKMAQVSIYDPATEVREELAKFYLVQELQMGFSLLPGSFFWDIDPSGRWLALALFDQILIEPRIKDTDPSLYLIDASEEEKTVEQLAPLGAMPAFSPDGTLLVYLGAIDSESQDHDPIPTVYVYNLNTSEKETIPNSGGVSNLFWIDNETLGATFDADQGYQMAKYLLSTDEWAPLLAIPVAQFSYSPTRLKVSEEVAFDASNSQDFDGKITGYDWDFGDGTTEQGIKVTHTYQASKYYEVELNVVDDEDYTDSISKMVIVTSAGSFYADKVLEFQPGAESNPDFTDSEAALGIPDMSIQPPGGFVGLGVGGSITLEFTENEIIDKSGDDIRIWGDPENDDLIQVEVSTDGNDYLSFGSVGEIASLDLAEIGLNSVRFVRIIDDGNQEQFDTEEIPGAEIDAVEAIHSKPRTQENVDSTKNET